MPCAAFAWKSGSAGCVHRWLGLVRFSTPTLRTHKQLGSNCTLAEHHQAPHTTSHLPSPCVCADPGAGRVLHRQGRLPRACRHLAQCAARACTAGPAAAAGSRGAGGRGVPAQPVRRGRGHAGCRGRGERPWGFGSRGRASAVAAGGPGSGALELAALMHSVCRWATQLSSPGKLS